MQMPEKGQLSLSQFTFTIYKTQIGIAVLSIPREVGKFAGRDSWISILIGWLITMVFSLLIINIMKKHPDKTLFDILPIYFGKWLGGALTLFWAAYGLYASFSTFYATLFLIQVWILPNTPTFSLYVLFLIPVYMLCRHGIIAIGHYSDFVYLFCSWMPMLLLFSVHDAHWLNLLPIAAEGWLPILTGVQSTLTPFLGFEMAFVLYPYLQEKKKATKGILIACTMSMLVYLLVIILANIIFSDREIQTWIWPTLALLKPIQFAFLERLEILFLSFYTIIQLMTVIPYLYLALRGLTQLTRKSAYHPLLLFIVAAIAVSSLFVDMTNERIERFLDWLSHAGLVMAFGFVAFLWTVSQLRHLIQRRRAM
jgi:spore germination protein (amino acid permease)